MGGDEILDKSFFLRACCTGHATKTRTENKVGKKPARSERSSLPLYMGNSLLRPPSHQKNGALGFAHLSTEFKRKRRSDKHC